MFKDKKILITGATGFIGSNLTRHFLKKGARVTVFLRKTSNNWRIKDIYSRLEHYSVDLRNRQEVIKEIKKAKPDIIIHTATYGGRLSEQNFKEILETNFLGTANLLDACSYIDYELFINTGTSSEYGVKSTKMKESDILQPITAYGISKAAATLYALQIAAGGGRPIVTLRLFSPYGYYDDKNRLITTSITYCLKNMPLKLSTPGAVRDFIFIEDVLDAYEKAYQNRKKIQGLVFNIGCGRQHSVEETVSKIVRFTKSQTRPKIGKAANQLQEPRRWLADITRAKEILGWYPRHDLSLGLKKTIQWFKDNLYLYQ